MNIKQTELENNLEVIQDFIIESVDEAIVSVPTNNITVKSFEEEINKVEVVTIKPKKSFELNKLIKQKRIEMGLTLTQLEDNLTELYGEKVVSKPFINQIELGNQNLEDVSVKRVFVLTSYLGISTETVLDFLGIEY